MQGTPDMVQSPDQFAAAFGAIISEQREQASLLLTILASERTALNAGDLSAMDAASVEKVAVLGAMEQLKTRADELLVDTPFASSDAPVEQALSWCDTSGNLRAARDDVARLMSECDLENRRNGLVVQHRLNYVRRAIDILHAAHEETMTYGADGIARSGGSSRLLAEG